MAQELITSQSRHNARQVHVVPSSTQGPSSPDVPMVWRGTYETGDCFVPGDVVLDDGWLVTPNRPTCDKPAPVPVGEEHWLYTGPETSASPTAIRLTFGQRFSNPDQAFYLTGWRAWVVAGAKYAAYSNVGGVIKELLAWQPLSTGWAEFNVERQLVPAGSALELFVVVEPPDAAASTFTGNWYYDTPNNPGIPTVGQIRHPNQNLGVMSVHKTDNDGGDRSTDLAGLEIGDTIEALGTRWAIQSITDQGAYIDFGVSPSIQASPDGVASFTFETETAVPITLLIEPDWWLSEDNIDGLYSIDGGDLVVTDDAYGVDIRIQDVDFSDAWEVLAISDGAANSGAAASEGVWMLAESDQVLSGGGSDKVVRWLVDRGTPAPNQLGDLTTGPYGVRIGKSGLYTIEAQTQLNMNTNTDNFRHNIAIWEGVDIDTGDKTSGQMLVHSRFIFVPEGMNIPGSTASASLTVRLDAGQRIAVSTYHQYAAVDLTLNDRRDQTFLRVTRIA